MCLTLTLCLVLLVCQVCAAIAASVHAATPEVLLLDAPPD
jgi:hypothetical protein